MWQRVPLFVALWALGTHGFALREAEGGEDEAKMPLPKDAEWALETVKASLNQADKQAKARALDDIFQNNSIVVSFENPDLTYGQRLHILAEITNLLPKLSINNLPTSLLAVLPSHFISDLEVSHRNKDLFNEIAYRVPEMLPAQQLALFTSFLQISDGKTRSLSKANQTAMFTYLARSPRAIGILSKFFGTKGFREVLNDFKVYVANLNPQSQLEVLHLLPFSLKRVWLESLGSQDPGLAIMAIGCQEVANKSINFFQVLKLANKYNVIRQQLPAAPFPKSLLTCFKHRVEQELLVRGGGKENETVSLDVFSMAEINRIGGVILASLDIKYLRNVKDDERALQIHRVIGRMQMADIISSLSNKEVKELADLAIERILNEKKTMNDINSVDIAGSLLMFTTDVVSKMNGTFIKNYINDFTFGGNFQKIACLGEKQRNDWREALINGFGAAGRWAQIDIALIGDLMVVLNDGDFKNLKKEMLYDAHPVLLEENHLDSFFATAPYYTNETKIISVCQTWLGGDDIMAAYYRRNRFLVQVAEFRALVEQQDLVSPSQEVINSTGLNRNKRQVINEREVHQTWRVRINGVFKTYSGPKSEVLRMMITMQRMEAGTRDAIVKILGLTRVPPREMRIEEFVRNLFNSNQIPEELKSAVEGAFEQAQIEVNHRIVEMSGMTHLHFGKTKEVFCQYFTSACEKPIYNYLVRSYDSQKPFKGLRVKSSSIAQVREIPSTFTCQGIMQGDQGVASVLKAEDLDQWSKEELEYCTEILGTIQWNTTTKTEVYNLLKTKNNAYLSLQKVPPRHQIILGGLLEPLVTNDPNKLSLEGLNYDSQSVLGQFPFNPATERSVAKMIEDNQLFNKHLENNITALMQFGSLGHILCGLSTESVKKAFGVSNLVSELLLAIFGQLNECSNRDVLKVAAEAAIKVYGDLSKWKDSDIYGLGAVVAGLESDDNFAKNFKPAFISDAGFKHLTAKHLLALESEQKIESIPVEVMKSLDKTQTMTFKSEGLDFIRQKIMNDTNDATYYNRLVESMANHATEADVVTEGEVAAEAEVKTSIASVIVTPTLWVFIVSFSTLLCT